ncbi:unnamed protein product [Trichobilharzia szidati]|nr:unnamed protein product [Trichobilharzia szidati]
MNKTYAPKNDPTAREKYAKAEYGDEKSGLGEGTKEKVKDAVTETKKKGRNKKRKLAKVTDTTTEEINTTWADTTTEEINTTLPGRKNVLNTSRTKSNGKSGPKQEQVKPILTGK